MKSLARRDFCWNAAAALAACVVASVAAQESNVNPVRRGQPFDFPQSDVRSMVAKSGAEYRILISWPAESPPPGGYPILYFLDGEQYFATVAETASVLARATGMGIWQPGIVPGIVVGIGYPGVSRRGFDFTPPGTPALFPGRVATGGADLFLTFITDELRPTIEADFPVDRNRQTLMGQSAGGIFVLHTLYTRPELFNTYVAGSPAIGFFDEPVPKGAEGLAAKLRARDLKRKLIVTAGENEEAPIVVGSRQASLLNEARALAERLGRIDKDRLEVKLRVLSGEDHYTVPLPLISETLLRAFAVPK